jgi:hypothetical protein
VRLFASQDGKPVAIGYRLGDVSIKGAELGPGHSWHRFERGLRVGPQDTEALSRVVITIEGRGERPEPSAAQLARVRLVVEGAANDRPNFTEFVRRVEAAGVEVRLFAEPHARPTAISYGLGDVSVRGEQLGPGHSWRRLQREAVSLDYQRDRVALTRVTTVLTPDAGERRPLPQLTQEDLARVRQALDAARMSRPTLTEYARRAEALGVEVRFYQDPKGRVSGVSYAAGNVPVKARELGPEYGWKGLKQTSVVYHAGHDRKAVVARATPVDEPRRSSFEQLSRGYHVGREAVEWVRRPHRQAVRLAGRLVTRAVAQVVSEIAHAAARRRDGQQAEVSRGVRVELRRGIGPRARPSVRQGALARGAAPAVGDRRSRAEGQADQALARLANRVLSMADRSKGIDWAAGGAIGRLRQYAARGAKNAIGRPARMMQRGR